ncbi:hypothetical protein [Georgenia sp.]
MSTYAVTSEVLDNATIVQVVVEDTDWGPWTPATPGIEQRSGTVTVRLADVLRGALAEAPGDVLGVPVAQRRHTGRRPVGGLGPWAAAPTDPGAALVAFAAAAATLAAALDEAHCRRIVLAGAVLADLRRATGLLGTAATAEVLLAAAEGHRGEAGALFATFVWVAAREALRDSLDRFDRLMAVAEDPGTRVEAQETYLVAAHEDMTFTGTFSAAHRARLARAMLRSALDPRLGTRRRHLLSVYLPTLVGLEAEQTLPVADVLGDDPGLREQVRAELDDPRDPTTTSPALRAWLREG